MCFPLLSRWLGPAAYGVYALAATVIGLASTLGLSGLDMAYARYFLDSHNSDQQEAVEAYCWTKAIATSALCTLPATFIWLLLSKNFAPLDRITVAFFVPVAVVLSVLSTMATTRIRLSSRYSHLAVSVASAAVASALISLLVAALGVRGVLPLLLGTITTSALSVLLLGLPPLTKLRVKSLRIPRSKRHDVIKLGMSCAVTGPLYWLIASSDRWFLALNRSETEVGIYSIASTLALMGIMVNSAVHLALFPEASRLVNESFGDETFRLARLWEQLAVLLLIVMVFVGSLGEPLLRILTAPSFHGGASYIPWLACGSFFYGLAGLGNLPFFLSGKMERVAILWGFISVLCLILNILLIPPFGGLGAAIAQMLTYVSLSLVVLISGQSFFSIPLRWGRLTLALLLGLTGLFGLTLITISSPMVELMLDLIISVGLGFLLVWLVSPSALGQLLTHANRLQFPRL